MAEQGKSWLLKLLGWLPLPQTKILSAAAQKGQEKLNQGMPVFRNRDEYQQWLAQQGTGTKIKETFAVGWARTKARAAGALPEQQPQQQAQQQPQQSQPQSQQQAQQQPQYGNYQPPPGPQEPESKGKKAMALIMTLLALAGSAGYVFLTPAGHQLLGEGTKSVAALTPYVGVPKAALNNIWQVGVLGQLPEQTFGAEKVKTEEKKDVGLKIVDIRPRRTEYPSPSQVEIEGHLTAVSPTENPVSVKIEAFSQPDASSVFGVTEGESMACQIDGVAVGQKLKTTEITSPRRFVCQSVGQYCANTMPGAQVGESRVIPVNVKATILGTTTSTVKTTYFSTNAILSNVNDPVSYFKLPRDELVGKQYGDNSISLGIGIASGEDVIEVAGSTNLVSDYLLGVSVKNPDYATGSINVGPLALMVESPPVEIVPDATNDFTCAAGEAIQTCSLKDSSRGSLLDTGQSKTYYLKFRVPQSALSGQIGSFRAKATLVYDYATPAATSVTIKSYGGNCCSVPGINCPAQQGAIST